MSGRRVLIAALLLATAGSAHGNAAAILSPTAVVANTLGTAGGSTNHLIDQTGLSANFISGVTDFDTYIALSPTSAVVSPSTGWASPANMLPGYLEFDLGANYALSGFVLWTQNNPLAVNSFTLSVAADQAFTTGVTDLGTFNAAEGLNAQTYTVAGTGEFVRLEINSTHGVGATSVNIGEVAFDAQLIPEPGALSLLGLGFAAIRVAGRRCRRQSLT